MKQVVIALLAIGCSQPPNAGTGAPRPAPQMQQGARTLTIMGTNDLHGAVERLPLLAGYVANVREARAADGGGLVLLDGGDMFQGTLESNLAEGEHVIRAYNEIGYTAAAVGNHEFDFGPVGPEATPKTIEDDARGALKARAAEAKFPLLIANVSDEKSGVRIKWPNMPPSVLTDIAGVQVGVIGVATEATPFTTMPANFAGLVMKPPVVDAIVGESKELRAKGAQLIVVAAHIGTRCKELGQPNDHSSCDKNEELYKIIDALPKRTVDVIVAGHTHAAIAHRINDIAVIQSYSSGRAFGRVDLRLAADGHVTSVKIHQPRMLCEGEGDGNPMPVADCKPGDYEGKPVVPSPAVQKIVDDAVEQAKGRRHEKLGVTLTATVTKSYGEESAEGNWFTDLMLAAEPSAQVAVTNGGGLRADIPAGELTYGGLYEAMPFDNRFALVELKGAHLRKLVSTNLQRGGAILSWGGLTAKARCKGSELDLVIKVRGKALDDNATYKLVTSDFLASGGDGLIGRLKLPDGAVTPSDVVIRDALAEQLKKKKGTLDPATLHSPTVKRMDYEGTRPVSCGSREPKKSTEESPE